MSHIIFFVSSMHGGGAERVAALLCNRWAERGHNVTLVVTYSGRGQCVYPLDKRVKLVYLADIVGTVRKTPWIMLRRFWALRRLVRDTQADVVVSFMAQVNIAVLLATRGLGVPIIVSERFYPPAMPLPVIWKILRRITYPWAAKVVMQTQGGLQWLQRAAPASRGVIIANPCVFPLPESKPKIEPDTILPAQRCLLLAAGRLEKQKGFDLLIDAFSSLCDVCADWDLVILGEGVERQALEAQIASKKLNERVLLPGRVGNAGDWYQRADLYVMSSRFEGFPNTLLEALAYGLPAVSFDCLTGPADLIRDGVDGYLVQPQNGPAGLAASLAALMQDPARRAAFAANASDVKQRYSFATIGTAWDEALSLKPCFDACAYAKHAGQE